MFDLCVCVDVCVSVCTSPVQKFISVLMSMCRVYRPRLVIYVSVDICVYRPRPGVRVLLRWMRLCRGRVRLVALLGAV